MKTFIHDILGGIKKPGAYIFFDIATIAAELFFFDRLANGYKTIWLDTFLYVYAGFCVAILLKSFDRQYLSGLDWILHEGKTRLFPAIVFFVYFLSPVIGGLAYGSLVQLSGFEGKPPAYFVGTGLLVCLVVYPAIFALGANRRALAQTYENIPAGGVLAYVIKVVSGAGIYVMNLYMLALVYGNVRTINVHELNPALKILAIAVALLIFTLLYMPARIHYFIDEPRDRGNWAWFVMTVVTLVVYAFTGIDIL